MNESQEVSNEAEQTLYFVIGGGFILALIIGAGNAAMIIFPLKSLQMAIASHRTRQLNHPIKIKRRDEIGKMARQLDSARNKIIRAISLEKVDWDRLGQQRQEADAMTDRLAEIIATVREDTTALAAALDLDGLNQSVSQSADNTQLAVSTSPTIHA